MKLRIYNTLHGKKEEFVPLEEGRVSLYVCGVTTYNHSHVGHARAIVVFDVVFRELRRRGYDVRFVRNYTDVDDKIIQRSAEEGVSSEELADRYVEATRRDIRDLGCLPPTHEPRVTTCMDEIIAFIDRLVRSGHAYAADGDVYFSVASFPSYGALSGQSIHDLKSGARIEVSDRKRSPLDFALWKASKEGEPAWESPWGPGRPGWHIECSAMCRHLLGDTIDIHGGGSDLIFPHHENEIAQSEAANGVPLARYWMHNGMLTVNQEKMAKSLGNFTTIRELLSRYHAETLRLFLLSTHYRSPADYADARLIEAEIGLERLYSALAMGLEGLQKNKSGEAAALLERFSPRSNTTDTFQELVDKGGERRSLVEEKGLSGEKELLALALETHERFDDAMADDFNTARALGHLFELARGLARFRTAHKKATPFGLDVLGTALAVLLAASRNVLGLLNLEPHAFQKDLNTRRLEARKLNAAMIAERVERRRQARLARDFVQADRIRDELAEIGVTLEDTPGGTLWKVAPPTPEAS